MTRLCSSLGKLYVHLFQRERTFYNNVTYGEEQFESNIFWKRYNHLYLFRNGLQCFRIFHLLSYNMHCIHLMNYPFHHLDFVEKLKITIEGKSKWFEKTKCCQSPNILKWLKWATSPYKTKVQIVQIWTLKSKSCTSYSKSYCNQFVKGLRFGKLNKPRKRFNGIDHPWVCSLAN